MTDNIDFDFSDLDRLAADIAEAPRQVRPRLRQAVEVTSRRVKDGWRDKLLGSDSLPALPYAVTYDVTSDNSSRADIEGEIGFDKDRAQGPLGNLSEFGSVNNPPRGYGLATLEENQADFEKGITLAVEQGQREAGL